MNGILRAFEALVFDRHSPVERDAQAKTEARERTACTVLAIDDDPAILQILRPLLREEGFNVLTSSSGPKGLDMTRYAGRDIRIVLLDYNMPQFNGAETLQYIRRLSPNTQIIALTCVDINLLPESFREGVDKFLQKPFRTTDLIAAIRELLGEDATVQTAGPA